MTGMKLLSKSLPAAQVSPVQLWLPGACLAALLARVLSLSALDIGSAPAPYILREVLFVSIVAAVPCGIWLAAALQGRFKPWVVLSLGCLLLSAFSWWMSGLELAGLNQTQSFAGLKSLALSRSLLRTGLSVGFGSAIGCLLMAYYALRSITIATSNLSMVSCSLLILLIVPDISLRARVSHESARFSDLLQQTRLGDAEQVAEQILALDPAAEWEGGALHPRAQELLREVRALREQVALPLSRPADTATLLDRARSLAIVGANDAAVAVIMNELDPRTHPGAALILGMISETRRDWDSALKWYSQALLACEIQLVPSTIDEQIQALVGVASCQRKLDLLPDATANYQRVLELAPTAESHFLLAQFYEDTQQTAFAQQHAQQAVQLDPVRYATAGKKLLQRLQTAHFGCYGVFRSEALRPAIATDSRARHAARR